MMRKLRREISYGVDRFAAHVAIWALERVFGACEPPHEPECMGCVSAKLIAACRESLEEFP